MELKPVFLFLHIAGVVVWVGGMFFAYVCLRPVAAQQLQPPQRLPLWAEVLGRFFAWVWAAVTAVLVSGVSMLLQVGMAQAPLPWHLMFGIGLVMMLIFGHVYFSPYQRLRRAVLAGQWEQAGSALNQIRRLVALNLTLGVATIAIATLGHLF
jgi:uncharacterized membrane protein